MRLSFKNKRIDWIIQGGESGRGKRPFYTDWAKKMNAECEATDTAYFFKQIDKVQEIPDDLLIREYPDQAFATAKNACRGCASKSEIFTKGFII